MGVPMETSQIARWCCIAVLVVSSLTALAAPAASELIIDETETFEPKSHGDELIFEATIQWEEGDDRTAPLLIIDPGTTYEQWIAMEQKEHTNIQTGNATTFIATFTIDKTMESGTHHYKILNPNSGLRTNTKPFEIGKPLSLWPIIGGIVQLVLGLVLAMVAIYLGIKLLDRVMPNLELLKELRDGNLAMGLVMIGVVFSMGNIIKSGIAAISASVTHDAALVPFVLALVGILIGIVMAVIGIFLALKILVRITPDIPIEKELKERNLAVGAITLGVLVAVSFVVEAGANGISNTLVGI